MEVDVLDTLLATGVEPEVHDDMCAHTASGRESSLMERTPAGVSVPGPL
jgi:hypothetical protein